MSFRLAALTLLVVAGLSALATIVAIQSRASVIREAETAAENLALALEQHTSRTFEAVDLSLRIVQNRIETESKGWGDGGPVHLLLRDLAEASPQIRSLLVIDDAGSIVFDSVGAVPRIAPGTQDRKYFIVHRDSTDVGLFIQPTIRNRINGQWTIVTSRRISKADGTFGGIAIAAVDPEHFRDFYEKMTIGDAGSISLISADGIMMVRRPWLDAAAGSVLPQALLDRLNATPAGLFETVSPNDGVVRLVAHRRSDSTGLIAVVGLSRETVLGPWRRDMAILLGAACVVVLLVVLLAATLARALKRMGESETLFRAVFDGATDGIFVNRVLPSGGFAVETYNAAAAALTGMPVEKAAGRPIREILGADEATKVEADLTRCIEGGVIVRFEHSRAPEKRKQIWEVVQVPLWNESGSIDRIFVSTRDITHLKLAETQAREANRFLLLAEQIAQVGHWRLDLSTNNLTWSQEVFRIHGQDPSAFKPDLDAAIDAYHPEDRQHVRECVGYAIETASSFDFTLRVVRPDGEHREIVSRGLCESDTEGNVTALFGTIMDVTSLRRAERELAEKSALLEVTLDNMDQGLALIAPDGTIEVANRRCSELMGLPDNFMDQRPTLQTVLEHLNKSGEFDDIDPALRAHVLSPSSLMRSGLYERRRPNGKVIEVRTTPLPGDLGVVRTYTDITARRDAEAATRDSEARYRLLAETTNDVITKLNLDFKRDYVSPTCRKLLGYEPEELLGNQPSDAIHPEDAPAVRELARQLVAGNAQDDRVTVTYRTLHKAGHWLWIEASMTLVRKTDTQAATAIICSLRDMSLRKQAEQALADSEARYRLLAENTSELIMLGHDDGRRSYISPASMRLLGFTAVELAKLRLRDYVHPEDIQRLRATTTRLSQSEDQVSLVFQARHKVRGWIWIEGSFRRIANAAVDQPSIVATFRDVSERQEQARALEHAKAAAETAQRAAEFASQAKTDFLASMSHEIRTPLHSIIGFTDLLIDNGGLSEDQALQAERIQSSGAALLTVVNDILDFSKIEAGQVELDQQPFSLDALVDNTVSIVRGIASAKGLTIEDAIDHDVPRNLLGDEDRLRQILLNLLNNAVKFTPNGRIELQVSRAGVESAQQQLKFAVKDTGIGISPDRVSRLFQRFSQVDGSIRRDFGGTGLGLAISKRLVELMGGKIGVESRSSEGSTFWFVIPLQLAQMAHSAKSRVVPALPAGRPASILLVEDLEINQKLAIAVLESAGHYVDVLGDGAEAIMAVQTNSYDLVLMDVQMPGMDGMTATRRIRALNHASRSVPIIAMTANVLPAQIAEFRAAGMDDHVGKPFKRGELLSVIDRLIQVDPKPDNRATELAADFDQRIYDRLISSMGRQATHELLAMLSSMLRSRLSDERLAAPDRQRLAADAHAMISAVGMLGFLGLSKICAELERAAETDTNLTEIVATIRSARLAAFAKIDELTQSG